MWEMHGNVLSYDKPCNTIHHRNCIVSAFYVLVILYNFNGDYTLLYIEINHEILYNTIPMYIIILWGFLKSWGLTVSQSFLGTPWDPASPPGAE